MFSTILNSLSSHVFIESCQTMKSKRWRLISGAQEVASVQLSWRCSFERLMVDTKVGVLHPFLRPPAIFRARGDAIV